MKKHIIIIIILSAFIGCANYTVNISTIPAEQVEVYLNGEYRGTTQKDGTLTFRIKEVSFADDQINEAKKKDYYGFLTVNYTGAKQATQNVFSIDKVENKRSISQDENVYNAIFFCPGKRRCGYC